MPRIGADATRSARIYSLYYLAMAPCITGTGAMAGLAFSAHLVWAGACLIVVGVLLIAEWIYLRHRLASQLSSYLDIRVTWHALPRLRYKEFDRWLASQKAMPGP